MLILNENSTKQLYFQIYEYYRNQILSGAVGPDLLLPSTRKLSRELSVSRSTVETAYQQLLAEGYIYSRPGSGYYTADARQPNWKHPEYDHPSPSFEAMDDTAEEDRIELPGIKYNFQYGRLEADSFPLKTWKRIANQILLDINPVKATGYSSRTGEPALKKEIAKYIYHSRGVTCEADRITICSGVLIVISLLSQLFQGLTPRIAIEDPCYDAVRNIFQNNGYPIDPIPLLERGLDFDRLEKSKAKLIYVTPSHQFPSGQVMTVNHRIKLLQWAVENDSYIIEDDYDSEYRYNCKPLPSLQSLDRSNRVIYTNTFSKSLAPALRLSFMVLPPALKELYDEKFQHYGCTAALLTQLMMAEFMAGGYWNRHLSKIALSNKKKHDLLVSEIERHMGERVRIQGNNAGLHFLLSVYNGMDEEALMASARKKGVMVYPVSPYYYEIPKENNRVLIGFSGLTSDKISAGVRLMREAWF